MKKFLSVLCVLAMILSVVNPAAFAAIDDDTSEIIVLEEDASNITIDRDTTIDLNGHNIDGVSVLAGTLYLMDSQTADYTVADGVYGHVTGVTGNVKAAEGYLQVGDSFHAVNLDIYAMTLRASDVGVYYKSNFAADEIVAAEVESFGVALSVVTAPNASNLETYCGYSEFTGFEAGEGANSVGTSTLLKGIMKAANGDSKNAKNAAMPVYGSAYIKTSEGYYFGETVKRSLQEQVEAINGVWDTLNYTQKAPILEMLEKFAFVKNSWSVSKMEGVLIPGLDSEIEMPIAVTADNGIVAEDTTVSGDAAAITVPAGAQLAAGADTMTLTVTPKAASDADVEKKASEAIVPVDVHVTGLVAENAVPVLITLKNCLPAGLNDGNVKLYHVENGVTVAMTRVETPVNHNEFSYDPLTGEVVLAMASFSEVTLLADSNNAWDGSSATAFAGGDGTVNNPFEISNANQLAYFRDQVDGGNNFAGQYIKLTSDINLGGVINFDPIGYGYESKKYMDNGRTFNGIFDGWKKKDDKGNVLETYTISGLYQNGWEMNEELGKDVYSYSMAGGGLFASVVNATIRNLRINNANIVMECVDMGILVGYSQGDCTYEFIEICNSEIANYQRATGGVVGEVSPRRNADGSLVKESNTHTFKNIYVAPNVVVGSLWGDFDAPVGGVLGARWDDNDSTLVVMENVTVDCRLDVYNDVTSAYQWHAYRRAGMLIGNTDTPAANGKVAQVATADFLTCTNVTVHFGEWAKYHYCQFTNSNNPGKNYPWVRVEEGENCSAYSNPRYGHPVDVDGNQVTSDDHEHKGYGEHNVQITFGQLYGGGQGVYGKKDHPGVTVENIAYTITFMQDGKILNVQYIYDNNDSVTIEEKDDTAWGNLNASGDRVFDGWVNAGSTKVTQIDSGNKKDIVLYPSWKSIYTARFVDQFGNVIYEEEFDKDTTKLSFEPVVPEVQYCEGSWSAYTLGSKNITIYPVYTISGMNAEPVDEDSDGATDYYKINAVTKLSAEVKIPGYINSLPVKVVADLSDNFLTTDVQSIIIEPGVETINANAFEMTPNLKEVQIPATVTSIGSNAFANAIGGGIMDVIGRGKKVTIKYDGTWAKWQEITANSWDSGLAEGSLVICTDGTYKKTGRSWGSGWEKQ